MRVAPSFSRVSPHPAQALDNTNNLYLAMHNGTGTLTLLTVSGVPGVSMVTAASTPLSIRGWSPPPNALQAGTNVRLDTGDERVLSVAWRSNSLWLAGNEACTPVGDSLARSCLRLIEMATDSPTVRQDMTFGAAGTYYYYPALRSDSSGNVALVFTGSSSNTFADVRVTSRLATDPLNTLQASSEIHAGGGSQTHPSGRMGDYSGAAVDPSDSGTIWVMGEYIKSTGTANWATSIGSLSFAAAPTTFTLSVTKAGTGSGTVISSPAGIDCGTTCSANFPSGQMVTLTASPASGSTFAGWSGACTGTGNCVVTMNSNISVTATFNASPTTFTLSVTKAGTGSGTVLSSPAGINCGTTCSANFSSGQTVTLAAIPAPGSTFAGWSGACTGTGLCRVTMTSNRSVTATFNK